MDGGAVRRHHRPGLRRRGCHAPVGVMTGEPGGVRRALASSTSPTAAGFGLLTALGCAPRTTLTVAAGIAQIGELSFMVAGLGRTLGLLPEQGYQFVITASLLSITVNPLMFR